MRWEGGDDGDERGDSTARVGVEFLTKVLLLILSGIAVSLGGRLAGWEAESGCAEVQSHHSSIEVPGGAHWGHGFHGVADIGRLIAQAGEKGGGGREKRSTSSTCMCYNSGHYIMNTTLVGVLVPRVLFHEGTEYYDTSFLSGMTHAHANHAC